MPPSPLVPACCERPPVTRARSCAGRRSQTHAPAETRQQRRRRARRDADLPPRMAHHRTASASLARRAHRPPRLRHPAAARRPGPLHLPARRQRRRAPVHQRHTRGRRTPRLLTGRHTESQPTVASAEPPRALHSCQQGPALRRPLEFPQYTSVRFAETLLLAGMTPSIGTVGDAYDNALAETTMGLYKTECTRGDSPFRTGPIRTLAGLEDITSAWVHWYNTSRLMHRLGRKPPAEAEAGYYAHNRDGQPAVHT